MYYARPLHHLRTVVLLEMVKRWFAASETHMESRTGYSETVQVQCHWGSNTLDHPDRFTLGDRDYAVEELLDRWYGQNDTYFKLRAGDGNIYILRHNSVSDTWSLESFRRAASG